jgi:fatty acid desaturase
MEAKMFPLDMLESVERAQANSTKKARGVKVATQYAVIFAILGAIGITLLLFSFTQLGFALLLLAFFAGALGTFYFMSSR